MNAAPSPDVIRTATEITDALMPRVDASVTPIARQTETGLFQHGTGTLLTVKHRHFVVTAGHVFDVPQTYKQAIFGFAKMENGTANESRRHNPVHLRGTIHRLPDLPDVAILEITETVRDELIGRRFLNLGDTDLGPQLGGWAWACGYPIESVKKDVLPLGGHNYLYNRLNLPGVIRTATALDALKDYDPRIHFLLASDPDEMVDPNTGNLAALPEKYQGISGTSVWQGWWPGLDSHTEWRSKKLRVVGVQTGTYRANSLVKATAWIVVVFLLVRQFRDLWDAIDLRFPGNPDLERAKSIAR